MITLLSLSFPQVLPCSILIGYGRFEEEALPFDAAAQFAPSSCMVSQCFGIHSIPFVRAPLRLSAVSFAMPSTLSAERLCCLLQHAFFRRHTVRAYIVAIFASLHLDLILCLQQVFPQLSDAHILISIACIFSHFSSSCCVCSLRVACISQVQPRQQRFGGELATLGTLQLGGVLHAIEALPNRMSSHTHIHTHKSHT